jgi:hypothetical protein
MPLPLGRCCSLISAFAASPVANISQTATVKYLANAVSLYLEYTFESRAYGQPKDSMEMAATGHPKITIRISDRTKPLLTSQLGIAGGNPALFARASARSRVLGLPRVRSGDITAIFHIVVSLRWGLEF